MGGKRVKIVVFNPHDPGVTETYHPYLGKLVAGKRFELDEDVADVYIASGLLMDANRLKEPPARSPEKMMEE